MELLRFIVQGVLFFIIAFMFLMVITLIKVGLEALKEWNERR